MRVGFWIPHIDPRPGGLGVYVEEVCRRLFVRFPDHVVFTMSTSRVPDHWGCRDVVYFRSPEGASSATRQAIRYHALNVRLPRALREKQCDILFSPTHEGMVLSRTPQIIVVHDLTMLRFPSDYFSPLLRAYMRYVLPVVAQNSACVVAVSENTARDVEVYCGEVGKVRVVGEGFNADVFHPRSDAERAELLAELGICRPFLLYSGTMAPHKNVAFLLDVLAELRSRGKDWDLAFTGRLDAGEFGAIEARIGQLGLEDRILKLGYVGHEQLSALMQEAVAFVFPSLYEGFGLSPLNAMASGAFVVASNRSSLPQVLEGGGIMCDPTDVTAWVNALTTTSTNTSHLLRVQAVKSASRYSWDDCAQHIADVIVGAGR